MQEPQEVVQASRAWAAADYKRAIGYYSRVIELDPKAAWAHYNRGAAYQATGDGIDAQADFAEASRLDPELPVPEGENANHEQRQGRAEPGQGR